MAKESIFDKLKRFGKKIRRDELAEFSSEEKEKLQQVLKERKLELIAKSRLSKLERRLEPKPKKKLKETFEEIKRFREANLKRRAEQMQRTEEKKKRFKEIEARRIKPLKSKLPQRKPFSPTRLGRI